MPEQGISAGHQAASWKDPFLGKGTQDAEVVPRNQAELNREQRYLDVTVVCFQPPGLHFLQDKE